ncbi:MULTISPECIES: Bug family tripartite tricarboxylate transporter substrate binding protein [unclassified Variovorax]|uniref:Bug family tripartite tricarboxylate transporter substrate binding protein n=1 Tax=unclassified Variovorax TaxID=663243 RepID=UPI003F478526
MNPSRRRTLNTGLGLLGAAALAPFARAEQPYPNNVIKFIIPTPPGGGHDTMMRVIGQKLTEAWGQPSIVESKAGASGAIAAASVAKAAPDGYTLLVNYSAFISNLVLQPTQIYKMSEFAPVSMLALTPIAIGVRESLGVTTLKQLVDLARSKPGKISYGSYGQGSGGNFVGELLNMAAGIDTVHVPYKGEAPALQDLIGGQIDTAVVSLGGVSRYPGKIRALAVASPTRFPLYPDVPTFAEAGFPAVNMPGFGALFAPAATPKPILDKLTVEMARILKMPDVVSKLLELGFEPVGWAPEKLTRFLAEQLTLTQKLVATGRIKL